MLSYKNHLGLLALIVLLLRRHVAAQISTASLQHNVSITVSSNSSMMQTLVPTASGPPMMSTAVTTANPTTPDQCYGKKFWTDGLVDTTCKTIFCAADSFKRFAERMKCNDRVEDDRVDEIATKVFEYAEEVAIAHTANDPASVLSNSSVSFATSEFLAEIGFLNKEKTDLRYHSIIPDYRKSPASGYDGEKDSFKISLISLNSGLTSYFVLLLKNDIQTAKLIEFEDEKPAIYKTLENLKLYSWPKRSGKWVLNSQIVQIGFTPAPATMSEPIEVTFHHKELIKRKNHECIVFPSTLDNNFAKWTRVGCHRTFTDRFKTICVCDGPGNFAVVSQIDEESPPSAGFSRTFFTQIAMAISAFILLGLLCTLIYPVAKGYMHLVRVRIYFFHDIACFMVYFSFLIGVVVSNDRVLTDAASGCIHFFQTSVISWAFVEGIHNYHTLNPLYDAEVTSPTFFYNTIGWGIPAALSGACAGYPYELGELAEFSWMKIGGSGMLYFVVGPVVSIIAVLLSYGAIFYELRSYIGRKSDYPYRRAIEYYKRSATVAGVAFLTWYSGILARNDPGRLSFSYLFLAMYGIQGAIIIYLHFLKNHEISEYRASLKSSKDGSMSARTEEDVISLQTSSRFSLLDFQSEATLRSEAGSRKSKGGRKSAKSGGSSNSESGNDSDSESRSSSSSSSSSSGSSSEEDAVDEQQSVRYSAYQIEDDGASRSRSSLKTSSRRSDDDNEDSGRLDAAEVQGRDDDSPHEVEYDVGTMEAEGYGGIENEELQGHSMDDEREDETERSGNDGAVGESRGDIKDDESNGIQDDSNGTQEEDNHMEDEQDEIMAGLVEEGQGYVEGDQNNEEETRSEAALSEGPTELEEGKPQDVTEGDLNENGQSDREEETNDRGEENAAPDSANENDGIANEGFSNDEFNELNNESTA